MELRGNQLSRILNTIQILYVKKAGITASELHRKSNISLKTAYRDLAAIENAGLPLLTELRNGTTYYRLIESFRKDFPLTFSFDELMALYYSKNLLGMFEGTGFHKSIENIIKKVKNVIPSQALIFLENLENNFSLSKGQKIDYSNKKEYVHKINTAITNRNTIELLYSGTRNTTTTSRQINPYTLYFSRGMIYLIGYCHLRKDVRIFALTRTKHIKILSSSFQKPVDFDVHEYFGDSFDVYRGQKEKVKLFFTKDVAPFIRERIFHKSQKIHEDEGGLTLELSIAITPDFKTFLMGWGESVRILEPPELKTEIKEKHNSAAMSI